MTARRHFPDAPAASCTGPCHQGRRKCQTPEACQVPDDLACATGIVRAVLWTLAAYTVAIVVWVWLI